MEPNKDALSNVLKAYAVPDPNIVGKLPKGNIQLDFVGHADITRILIEIDPAWRWVPCGWDNGRPAIHVENGMATMWGELQLLGHARLGVGSVRADKPDLDKELVSDFLRNAAMRFGICLSLWTKQEWEDLGGKPTPAKVVSSKPAPKPASRPVPAEPPVLTKEQRDQFEAACAKAELDPNTVANNAGVIWSNTVYEEDLPKLRVAFKELQSFKAGQ